MSRMFGTDGVRGVANMPPMTTENVLQIGRATAYVCKQTQPDIQRHKIVIGKDTRLSGYMLENALTAGICSMGVDVLLVGPMPTPGISFITHNMRANAGLVISASHNPYQDNGIKIFSRDGQKLPDEVEEEIEDLITSGKIQDIRPTAQEVGRAKRIDDAIGRYIVFCKNTYPENMTLEGFKVVLDCSNGATYKVAPIIFSELGAKVESIHDKPDGTNINENCGSQHPQDLVNKVLESGADVGLAFDGDGDRLIAVDEQGQVLTGDHILTIAARYYKDLGLLANNLVVSTVMSNFGFGEAMEQIGVECLQANVGDRYVLEMMNKHDALIGGEASGHLIFKNHHSTGDGILAALQLLAAMQYFSKPLSAMTEWMKLYPQRLINIDVKNKPPIETVDELQAAIKSAEQKLASKGRVLVRYSGTQSMCRVMVEGPDEKTTEELCSELADTVTRCIG